MDKITACVADLLAMADTVESQDLSQAKHRIELVFTDADKQTGGHFGVAQNLRDQLGRALNIRLPRHARNRRAPRFLCRCRCFPAARHWSTRGTCLSSRENCSCRTDARTVGT
jgi:hypothetical protein